MPDLLIDPVGDLVAGTLAAGDLEIGRIIIPTMIPTTFVFWILITVPYCTGYTYSGVARDVPRLLILYNVLSPCVLYMAY